MKKTILTLTRTILCFLLLSPASLNSQILRDTSSLRLVKQGIEYIYNFQFNEAGKIIGMLGKTYPDHPVVYLMHGMTIYWKNYPLLTDSPERASFENDLRRCIELSEKKHNTADDAEYLLANLSARGLLLLYYADNDLSLEVVSLTPATYKMIRRSFDYTTVITDFKFFTGLYNYYREAYPQAYPVYKTLAFLFPRGDRLAGLKELQTVAGNSILYKAEASSFLSVIYSSFESDFDKAYAYSRSLHQLYPGNVAYVGMYIKNLLLVRNYEEAEKLLLSSADNVTNLYFKAQLSILNGILLEKKYHNYIMAEHYYLDGLREVAVFGHYGNEFSSYGYFGLSRISDIKGDKNFKKTYRRKAEELADFKKIDFNN